VRSPTNAREGEPHERTLALENVIAFGNGENDVDLLRQAGQGYAVANADPVVLEQIPRRTASNDECGVAQVMEKILAEADLRPA
jgi:hydroxymethylpyrimidine pyrophosphatase-like HAD family hydrolase